MYNAFDFIVKDLYINAYLTFIIQKLIIYMFRLILVKIQLK